MGSNKYGIHYASDSNKMGIMVQYPNESRNDVVNKQKFGFWMYDKNLDLLWKKEVYMPYTEKKMDIYDKTIDREGNILIVARVFNDETEKQVVDNKINFHFEILKFTKDSKSPIVIPFKFEQNNVSQLQLFQDLSGQIVCSGFYVGKTNEGKIVVNSSAVDGSFFLSLDPNNNKLSNIHKGFYEIPKDVLKQYESDKEQKKIENEDAKDKGNTAANNLKLRSIYFELDGSLILFGEQFYEVTRTSRNGNTTTTTTYYYYKDIIVQRIGGDGKLEWTKKIPKNQVQVNSDYGLGFRVLSTENGFNVLFMDNLKNLNLSTDVPPATHSTGINGILVNVNLAYDGSIKKSKIFDTREMEVKLNIINADKVGDNSFINRAWIKKASKICLLRFED